MDEYNDVTTKREEKTMKKVLLAIGGGIGVIVGAILIWKFVLPFIGFAFSAHLEVSVRFTKPT